MFGRKWLNHDLFLVEILLRWSVDFWSVPAWFSSETVEQIVIFSKVLPRGKRRIFEIPNPWKIRKKSRNPTAISSCKWRNFELKFLPYVGLVVLRISWKFQRKRMFSSQDNQFSRKLDFLTVLWNTSISCNPIIFRRKYPFVLKLLGYSKYHEAYI
jgi:hypothetical protein